MSRKSRTLLLTDAYLKWSTVVLITIMHFKMILLCSCLRIKFQSNAFRTFSVLNQEKKQTFCLFHFFPNLLLVEKKNENALKHVLISSNCAKHIQGDDIKVVRGYLKYVVVVCLRSNIMFLCGILLGSYIRPIPHTPHIKLNCGSLPIWDVTSKQIYDSFFSKKHPSDSPTKISDKYSDTIINHTKVYSLPFRTTLDSRLRES